jgi:pantoate--beta-alanine ligase
MVADLDVPVEVRGVPTVREPDGLALSSRNRYLEGDDRRAAAVLWRALQAAQAAAASGERSAGAIRRILRETVESEGRAALDSAEVADARTLEPLDALEAGRPARALLAARVGPARLIDNAALPWPSPVSSG